MQLCSGTHQFPHGEVCFEDGVGCPACGLIDEYEGLIASLNQRVEDLELERIERQ